MIGFLKQYLLSILVIVIILILCLMDTSQVQAPPIDNFDKWVHTIMFLGLSGVIFFDNTRYFRVKISKNIIFCSVFLFPVLFGGLIEIMQEYLTQTRSGDWFDFLFNLFGALLGWGIASLVNRRL